MPAGREGQRPVDAGGAEVADAELLAPVNERFAAFTGDGERDRPDKARTGKLAFAQEADRFFIRQVSFKHNIRLGKRGEGAVKAAGEALVVQACVPVVGDPGFTVEELPAFRGARAEDKQHAGCC